MLTNDWITGSPSPWVSFFNRTGSYNQPRFTSMRPHPFFGQDFWDSPLTSRTFSFPPPSHHFVDYSPRRIPIRSIDPRDFEDEDEEESDEVVPSPRVSRPIITEPRRIEPREYEDEDEEEEESAEIVPSPQVSRPIITEPDDEDVRPQSKVKQETRETEKDELWETPKINDEDKEVKTELERMKERLKLYGLCERKTIEGDGNCQFAAVSDQIFNTTEYHPFIRKKAVEWLRKNPGFMIDHETKLSDFLNLDMYPSWKAYCDEMAMDGAWGDHLTLLAIANAFQRPIMVVSSVETPGSTQGVTFIEPKGGAPGKKALNLSHWHERHYGSLGRVVEM